MMDSGRIELPGQPGSTSSTPAERAEHEFTFTDQAQEMISDAWAENTRRAFRSDWNSFSAWCLETGVTALPATAQTAGNYAAHLANERGLAPTSVHRALRTLKSVHAVAGHELSLLWAEKVMRSYRREWAKAGNRVKKAAPLVAEHVRRIVEVTGDDVQGARDRAMALIGFNGMFRRSELASLLIKDVICNDQGLRVYLPVSKTDQDGEGAWVDLPWGQHEQTCVVRATLAWIELMREKGVVEGALIRRVHKDGGILGAMQGRSISNNLQRLAKKAGLEGVSGHSLRSGGATTLAQNGVGAAFISQQGRWNPTGATVHGYIRAAGSEENPMRKSGL